MCAPVLCVIVTFAIAITEISDRVSDLRNGVGSCSRFLDKVQGSSDTMMVGVWQLAPLCPLKESMTPLPHLDIFSKVGREVYLRVILNLLS